MKKFQHLLKKYPVLLVLLLLFNSAIAQPSVSFAEEETPAVQVTEEATPEAPAETPAEAPTETPAETTTTDDTNDDTAPEETVDAAPVEQSLTILHTNDMHGRMEEARDRDGNTTTIGLAKLATLVDTARQNQATTFLFDGGDAFQGLPISNNSKGVDFAMMMNEVGYDAMVVGNHEFDFGYDQALAYRNLLNFPLLSANIYKDGQRVFQPYAIVERDGVRLAVIGATTPETATKTHPRNVDGVTFTDPITEVQGVLSSIPLDDVDAVVFLVHLGVDETTPTNWRGSTLAEVVSNHPRLADKKAIVIDGHSHTVFQSGQQIGSVTYAQTGTALNYVGKVETTTGQSDITASLISAKDTTAVTPNARVASMVAAAKQAFEQQNAEVVVPNNPVAFDGTRDNVRTRETNLGNLITDALYHYGQTGFAKPSDLAVTNGGGIRADIGKDQPITTGDIIKVLPFGNTISQIEVTGQQIKDMFAFSLKAEQQKNADGSPILDDNDLPRLGASGGFLHISGARVYFDPTKPADDRIVGIHIYNRQTQQYEPLDLTKTYYLATNDFLAAGGDGYTMLGGAREEGISMDAVLKEYLKTADVNTYATTPGYGYERIIPLLAQDDTDNDGVVNQEEVLAGRNPLVANQAQQQQPAPTPTDDDADDDRDNSSSHSPSSQSQSNKQQQLPYTGTEQTPLIAMAILFILVGGYIIKTRKQQ